MQQAITQGKDLHKRKLCSHSVLVGIGRDVEYGLSCDVANLDRDLCVGAGRTRHLPADEKERADHARQHGGSGPNECYIGCLLLLHADER